MFTSVERRQRANQQKNIGSKPDTPESLNRFDVIRNKINPIAKNVTTWVELIELEENRTLPKIT